ncbi:hypothetical protein BGZ98_009064 [Dissophora globulifera]|nr:hypothetical protein BGZ98_009064 [Dissophora globulifera]
MARQASGTAFRTVVHRKGSDSNLNASLKADLLGSTSSTSGVYEQNPRAYLYQQNQPQPPQQRPPSRQHAPSHPQHSRSHSNDNATIEWTLNNQLLYTEPSQHNDNIQHNESTDLKVEYTEGDAHPTSKSSSSRSASPAGRGRSRPRVQHYPFVATTMSDEPISSASLDADDNEPTLQPDTRSQPHSSGQHQTNHPETPQRLSSRTPRTRPNHPHVSPRLLTKLQGISDEFLSEPSDERSSPTTKDLPPLPPLPVASHFQLASRVRSKTEGGEVENKSPLALPTVPAVPRALSVPAPPPPAPPVTAATLVLSAPVPSAFSAAELVGAADSWKSKESKGLIPQDVLKSMDVKDLRKAMNASVIASRVYKVMNTEQLDELKTEQNDLEDLIESLNVELRIESRMRDASQSQIRTQESNPNPGNLKDATSLLSAATKKIDSIVQQIQEAMWSLMKVQRHLLQHESAILNAGLRRLDSENRELSRTIMQLDTARGQEKEEKIKWKKEHNRLKFQSILIPSTSDLGDFSEKTPSSSSSSSEVQELKQQHKEQLDSMEQYVKGLNNDILHKDECISDLSGQLQAVQLWADDFQLAIDGRKPTHLESSSSATDDALQTRLSLLQSSIEFEFKMMEGQTREIKDKVDELTQENATLIQLVRGASHPRTSSTSVKEYPSYGHAKRAQSYDLRQNQRTSQPNHVRKGSDLQTVLSQSLMEIDQQIQAEEVKRPSFGRPASPFTSVAPLSIGSSNNSSSNTSGLELSRSFSDSTESEWHSGDTSYEWAVSTSDEDTAVEDAGKQGDRMNDIVKELRQIVRHRSPRYAN